MVCKHVSLDPRAVTCSAAELAEFLDILLRFSPDAELRLGQYYAVMPIDVKGKVDWTKEIRTLFDAVGRCGPLVRRINIAPIDSSLTTQQNRDAFANGLVHAMLAASPTCSPAVPRIAYTKGGCDFRHDPGRSLERANETFRGARRFVSSFYCECVSEDAVHEEFLRSALALLGLVGPVRDLRFLKSGERISMGTFLEMLRISPALESLAIGPLQIDSMDWFHAFFSDAATYKLESMHLQDLELRDRASMIAFLDGLGDPTSVLAQRLHTLKFTQQMMQRGSAFAFEEDMVDALERLLRTNTRLRKVSIYARENVSRSAREALRAHNGDAVTPPEPVQREDAAARVALLSVVHRAADASTSLLGAMDAVILRRVFAFSATRWERQVAVIKAAF